MKKVTILFSLMLIASLGYSQLIINEVLYDPSNNNLDGDANGDGMYDQEDDSFIEFVNIGTTNFDASGYEIWDDTTASGSLRYIIPAGTFVPPNGALVVFGSGPLVGSFGGAVMLSADTTASHLNLNNSGEVIGVKDAQGNWVLFFDSDALSNNPNESYTRFPDLTGNFIQHSDTTAVLFSPGTQVNGNPFDTNFVVETVAVQAAGGITTITTPGGTLQLSAMVTPTFAADTTVSWSVPAGSNVVSVSASGLVQATADGSVWVKATSNDGTNISDSLEITVTNQSFSVEENALSQVKIYPNPAIDFIYLQTAGQQIDHIKLYNILGELIRETDGSVEMIPVSQLHEGIYLLEVSSNGKSMVFKFQKR